jgi:tetratricopeptide (TPR) repeat protein
VKLWQWLEAHPGRRTALVWFLLAAATAACYAQALGHGFVNYDDPVYVRDNLHLRGPWGWDFLVWAFTTNTGGNWHPLVWLSLRLDMACWGLAWPGGFHLTNLLLHIANALLLELVWRRLTGRWAPSALVAALFALHPLHVESVAWVSERKDTLSTLFWLVTMLAYAGYVRRPDWRRLAAVIAAYAAGLMCKSMLVTLPAVLLLLDHWPLGRLAWGRHPLVKGQVSPARALAEKAPLLVLAVAIAGLTVWTQRGVGAMASTEAIAAPVRLGNALVSYVTYLAKAVWPTGLQVFYPHPLGTLSWGWVAVCAAVLAALTAAVWWQRQRRYLTVGWAWYLGTLVPVIGLVQVGEQALADRYTYVPLIGLAVALAWGLAEAVERLRARWAGAGPLAAALVLAWLTALGVATWRQVGVWQDTATLFGHALRVNPDNYLAHGNLAAELAARQDYAGARRHFAEVLRLRPGDVGAQCGLGGLAYKEGQKAEAKAIFERLLARRPHHGPTLVNMAVVLVDEQRYAEAERLLRQALPSEEGNVALHVTMGMALHKLERLAEAERWLHQALVLEPRHAGAHLELGVLARRAGRLAEARRYYEQALAIEPKLGEAAYNLALLAEQERQPAEARRWYETALAMGYVTEKLHFNLGNLRQTAGELDAAIAHYRQALALNPAYQPAYVNLGVAVMTQGNTAEAVRLYQEAIRLKPDDPGAHNGLGAARFYAGDYAAAAAQFETVLRLAPTYAGARQNLDRARAALGSAPTP